MQKTILLILGAILILGAVLSGCNKQQEALPGDNQVKGEVSGRESTSLTTVTFTDKITQLENGFSVVEYAGEYGFDTFIEQGGAATDAEVVAFLSENLFSGEGFLFKGGPFGCSALAVQNTNGNALFGRNFDWQACNALVVKSTPQNSYSSISTVNMDFITGYSDVMDMLPGSLKTIAALYAPMDGMNDQGLCVAILMIQDGETIKQSRGKPGLTTTTAVRLLLNKAATVDEAIELLQQYDMNASMGMMVHFAISDANGKSVVVEYIDNEMVVVDTPAVTNFYLAQGEKNGIGTQQSHERYEILMEQLKLTPTMEMADVRDALNRVSKDNFDEFESTEWSTVYNQTSGDVHYYHRENYSSGYTFNLFH